MSVDQLTTKCIYCDEPAVTADPTGRDSDVGDRPGPKCQRHARPIPADNRAEQFCRKGIHNCIPAVTLTFDGGARRLHWCAEHADDAERYLASSDQAAAPETILSDAAGADA